MAHIPLTVNQAAEIIGIDPSQVRRHCRAGTIKALKAGPRAWWIMPAEARRFAKTERKTGPKIIPKKS